MASMQEQVYSSSSEDEEMLLSILLLRRRRRQFRAANREIGSQWWVSRRETHGTFANLVQELSCEDMEKFSQFHRLDRHSFEEVLALVAPLIEKKDTRLRCSVKPSERLSVTLRFLASGLCLGNLYTIKKYTLV